MCRGGSARRESRCAARAVGGGALGFQKALDELFPGTRHQRCWLHKAVNVPDKVPLSIQTNMNKDLRENYWAPYRSVAEAAIDLFAEKYSTKYRRAVDCEQGSS